MNNHVEEYKENDVNQGRKPWTSPFVCEIYIVSTSGGVVHGFENESGDINS